MTHVVRLRGRHYATGELVDVVCENGGITSVGPPSLDDCRFPICDLESSLAPGLFDLQINGFGLNTTDGFLYGIHEASNVANPFLTRVDKNGSFENLGTLLGPAAPGSG